MNSFDASSPLSASDSLPATGQGPLNLLHLGMCRAVIGLTILAGAWTFWQAREASWSTNAAHLWPVAIGVYLAGFAYLAATAWRTWLAWRGDAPTNFDLVGLVTHAVVVTSAMVVTVRGVESRGLIVGLGHALTAWGVVAALAGLTEALGFILHVRVGARITREGWLATTGAICTAIMLLGLLYLETRPLPHLPKKPHVPTGLSAPPS